ncbi:hypothetical protein HHK36_025738 [Tetracentron sinense]|uniref:Auxin-responsive protein n=1 Tax=Tetracentron sinense TaxID=13715 RepID=A0A835D3E8_TETSI|nr:hypothetical protein HHK36_025738 [Tetracentron sinense]
MAKEGPGLDITELRLGLPGSSSPSMDKNDKKRVFSGIANNENSSSSEQKTQTKNQIVGWPPVCSYRKNSFKEKEGVESSKFYVKVSMDGAPFLRKIDLNTHKGYSDLAVSFEKLFGCFGIAGLTTKRLAYWGEVPALHKMARSSQFPTHAQCGTKHPQTCIILPQLKSRVSGELDTASNYGVQSPWQCPRAGSDTTDAAGLTPKRLDYWGELAPLHKKARSSQHTPDVGLNTRRRACITFEQLFSVVDRLLILNSPNFTFEF